MAKAPPSFDFYTADFIEAVRLMEPDEVGAYMLLLCYQWKHGHIPETDGQRRRAAQVHCEDQWQRIWGVIRDKFGVVETDDIFGYESLVENHHAYANLRMHNDRNQVIPKYLHRCKVNKTNRLKRKTIRTTNRTTNREGGRGKSSSSSSKEYECPESIRKTVEAWLEYKRERKESYKPRGLKALITEMSNFASKHGEDELARRVNRAMSNNWKGWDHQPANSTPPKRSVLDI